MPFDKELYAKLEVDFKVWHESIVRKNASNNKTNIRIRTIYFDILKPLFNGDNNDLKASAKKRLVAYRNELKNCLTILKANVDMPDDLTID